MEGVDEINPPMHRAGWRYVPLTDFANERARLRQPNQQQANKEAGLARTSLTLPLTPQTINNYHYYGDQPNQSPHPGNCLTPPNVRRPNPRFSQSTPDHASGRASRACEDSPARRPYPPFDAFLAFAGVPPSCVKAREVLKAQGINDFGRLLDQEIYSIANLNSIGVPFTQAPDIFKAVPLYNQHLKQNPQ